VESGRRPVINEEREGLQTACWQYARSNVVPRALIRSRFGVLITLFPDALISGRRSSTAKKSTFRGFVSAACVKVANRPKDRRARGRMKVFLKQPPPDLKVAMILNGMEG
jgi:hypothetical protein